MDYANTNIEHKPTVTGIEVYIDEFGQITNESGPEVIFSYKDNEEVETSEADISEDELARRLKDLEDADLDDLGNAHDGVIEEQKDQKDPVAVDAPEADIPLEIAETSDDKCSDVDDCTDDLCGWFGLHVEPATVIAVPASAFEADFTDISKDEAIAQDCIDASLNPVTFMRELADELGIGDQVEITETGSDVEDDEIPDVDAIETVKDDEDDCPECDNPIDKSFDVDFFDSLEDEKEADHVAKCHVCPECGKEICECGIRKALEEAIVNNFSIADDYYAIQNIDFNEQDLATVEKGKGITGTCTVVYKDGDGNLTDNKRVVQFTFFPNEGTVIIKNDLNDPIEVPEKNRMEKVIGKDLGFEESLDSENLEEEMDLEAKFNIALAKAKEVNKPMMYGYSDHGKYYSVEPVEIDDMESFRKDYMARHPNNTMLIAYPDKSFSESLEEADMSDVELAEKLEDAIKEKHAEDTSEELTESQSQEIQDEIERINKAFDIDFDELNRQYTAETGHDELLFYNPEAWEKFADWCKSKGIDISYVSHIVKFCNENNIEFKFTKGEAMFGSNQLIVDVANPEDVDRVYDYLRKLGVASTIDGTQLETYLLADEDDELVSKYLK